MEFLPCTKTQLLFCCQQEVVNNVMCHPVVFLNSQPFSEQIPLNSPKGAIFGFVFLILVLVVIFILAFGVQPEAELVPHKRLGAVEQSLANH